MKNAIRSCSFGVLLTVCFAGLSGCSKDGKESLDIDAVVTSDVSTVEAAYYEYKRIPENATERRERAFNTFQQRSKIANHLAVNELSNNEVVKIQVREVLNDLVINSYFDAFYEESLTQDVVKAYYEQHSSDFGDTTLKVKSFLVRTSRGMSEQEVSNRKASIQEFVEDVRAKGIDNVNLSASLFDQVSESEIQLSKVDRKVLSVLTHLKDRDVSDPVETQAGIQVFYVERVLKSEVLPFSDVEKIVTARVKDELKKAEYKRLASSL